MNIFTKIRRLRGSNVPQGAVDQVRCSPEGWVCWMIPGSVVQHHCGPPHHSLQQRHIIVHTIPLSTTQYCKHHTTLCSNNTVLYILHHSLQHQQHSTIYTHCQTLVQRQYLESQQYNENAENTHSDCEKIKKT